MAHRLALALLLLASCGGAQRAPERRARADASTDDEPEEEARAASPRELGADATFADLVAIVARQDHLRDSDSDAGCILRTTAHGFRLDADLAVAVRPLPEVATDLDDRLARMPGPVRVLTRYGSYGDGSALGASAMTTTMPPRDPVAVLLVLTDRGTYVRPTDHAATVAGPLALADVSAALAGASTIFVTSEGGVPLSELRSLLAALPGGIDGNVGLALVLGEGTRLPDAAALDAPEGAALCPEGLGELAEDVPLGDLAAERLMAGLAPLRAAGEICVGTSTGTGARGGRVVVDVRIAAGGIVSSACIREDETGDPTLRACLVRALETLRFDDPGGVLDFELPLALAPGLSHRQRALCE